VSDRQIHDPAWLQEWAALPVMGNETRAEAASRFADELSRRRRAGRLIERPGAVVAVRREPWDCDRLGIEAGKLEMLVASDERAAVEALRAALEHARGEGLVHLSCRVDTRDVVGTAALGPGGFVLRDVVVTLSLARPVRPWSAPEGVREGTPSDQDALADLSSRCFAVPGDSYNRYLNDPHLALASVRSVYGNWARSSVIGVGADRTFVLEEDGVLAGFLTLDLPRSGVARVRLNAVDARHRKRGLYRRLVLAGTAAAWEASAQAVEIVTQLQQLAVQRTWWRLGATAIGSATSWTAWLGPQVSPRG
jgi:hypothetical protein